MQKIKSKSGITLIALVITIIVLLILAGISISMLSGDNSILSRAAEVKKQTDEKSVLERVKIAYGGAITRANGNYSGYEFEKILKEELNKEFTTYMLELENERVKIDNKYYEFSGEILDEKDITIPAGTYNTGQEIVFRGENFFVLEDKGNTVKLLAKYCLNKEGTAQVNLAQNEIGRKFSNTNYWSNDFTNSPFNLQTEEMITKAEKDGKIQVNDVEIDNASITARKYGKLKKVTGKLMTIEEANEIQDGENTTIKNIMWGKWNGSDAPTNGYYMFWLGDAIDQNNIYAVVGNFNSIANGGYSFPIVGVRPVIIVKEY